MLLIDALLTESAPKDTNLAEIVEVGKKKIQLSGGGHRFDPEYGGVYVSGLPFGTSSPPVLAPIDLLPGDKLKIIADIDDRAVYEVWRKVKGKLEVVWENKPVKDQQKAVADNKRAAREMKDRLGI